MWTIFCEPKSILIFRTSLFLFSFWFVCWSLANFSRRWKIFTWKQYQGIVKFPIDLAILFCVTLAELFTISKMKHVRKELSFFNTSLTNRIHCFTKKLITLDTLESAYHLRGRIRHHRVKKD